MTGLTGGDGNYQLSLTAAGSGIADQAGNALNTNASNIWSADFTAPTAATSLSNINAAGGNTYNFTVTYTDNTALDVSTLDSKNILVTGPDGKTQQATLVSFTPEGNGTPRTASYSFVPPGGTWDTADNGTYSRYCTDADTGTDTCTCCHTDRHLHRYLHLLSQQRRHLHLLSHRSTQQHQLSQHRLSQHQRRL